MLPDFIVNYVFGNKAFLLKVPDQDDPDFFIQFNKAYKILMKWTQFPL